LAAVGETGQAASDLRPSGKVLIEDRLIDVITEGDYVDAGTPIEVLRVEGNRVLVRKII
jgi:membrane-bound serine protease (ClpP class)